MHVTIEWQYQTKNGFITSFQSEAISIFNCLDVLQDIENTGRVHQLTIIDEYQCSWTMKELKRYMAEMRTLPHHITIYFDASYERETKIAGLGIVIYYEENGKSYRLRKNLKLNGVPNVNEAEYSALQFALDTLDSFELSPQTIEIIGDAQVVIQQLLGEWPAYEENLARFADKIEAILTKRNLTARFNHIPRKQNTEAHHLAAQALNDIQIDALIEK